MNFELRIPAWQLSNDEDLSKLIKKKLNLNEEYIQIEKKSLDARTKEIAWVVKGSVHQSQPHESLTPFFRNVLSSKEIFIIGSGPAGLFAALECIRLGYKPIILGRGKDVRRRRRDIARLTREHTVNPHSNYCFGEGGAGTFSDGKLYTRSTKRGDVSYCLKMFVAFGAPNNILYESRPHIGTNKLPGIIEQIRKFITSCGGHVIFDTHLTGLEVRNGRLNTLITSTGIFKTDKAILATGHSASDVYELMFEAGFSLEHKPYAIGFRIEHPQPLVDQWQYKCIHRPDYLPPAYYNISFQVKEQGVYSFCMCPGGIIAPCATHPGEVVTNGWSPSRRNNLLANAGFVTEVKIDDWKTLVHDIWHPLAGLKYRQKIEQKACKMAGNRQLAPAQRASDFLSNTLSSSLPSCSYLPGITSVNLNELFPFDVCEKLKWGLRMAEKRMPGFASSEALLVAPETRTSAPLRIPRNKLSLQHPEIEGLFPCGEGSGYAGGIISAAIDGINCARQACKN